MADFDAKTDTPAASTDVAATDRFIFGDVSADGWDTIQAQNVLAALARLDSGPNFALGAATIGTSGTNTLALKNGTAPTTQPADEFQLYSADFEGGAGDARLHVWGETGNPVALGNGTVAVPKPGSGAGRSLTAKGSDAASGNTNGGDVIALPGAKSGSGTDGRFIVRQPGGVAGTNEGQLYNDGTDFYVVPKQGVLAVGRASDGLKRISLDGTNGNVTVDADYKLTGDKIGINQSEVRINGTAAHIGAAGGGVYSVGLDTYLGRAAAAVWRTTAYDGSGPSWLQHTPADKRLNSAFTDATGTLANLTDLSITLIAGRKYTGRLVLFLSTDQAAEGAKLDFDGGTATMTSFSAGITANVQGATLGTTVSSAIATDLTATALNGTGLNVIAVDFTCVVNAAGTFIPRLAQNSHTSGTLTAAIGSSLCMKDMP